MLHASDCSNSHLKVDGKKARGRGSYGSSRYVHSHISFIAGSCFYYYTLGAVHETCVWLRLFHSFRFIRLIKFWSLKPL